MGILRESVPLGFELGPSFLSFSFLLVKQTIFVHDPIGDNL
jgi:hypothetical protein